MAQCSTHNLVLMERFAAEACGLQPMAQMLGYSVAAVDPAIMGIGPAPVVRQLLEKTGVNIDEIDLWEANEAFAAQALSVTRELGLDPQKVNSNGSGISLGHPVPGELPIQAAIGNSNNPRQCLSQPYFLISTTLLPGVSIGVRPFRPE